MTLEGPYTFNALFILVFIWMALWSHPLPIEEETKLSLGRPKTSQLNFTELATHYGYDSEEHLVITEDGYMITLFRLTSRRKNNVRGPLVLLMHGLLQSADSFADAGPTAGLAYLLADAGHDLWVGNVRGNYYARAHTHLRPEDSAFWDFCAVEMGRYDVPALLEYILQHTGVDKLNYIGFSQGAGVYLVMCSERPEYCDKAQVLIALSPAARLGNTKSVLYKLLLTSFNKLEWLFKSIGLSEIFPKGSWSQELLEYFCPLNYFTQSVCVTGLNVIDSVYGHHPGSITNETTRSLFGHFPAGTSLHNLAYYGQAMNSDKFRKFDYGEAKNLDVYGSVDPPDYNLTAVSVPVVAIYGRNDGMVAAEDIEWVLARLPNVEEAVMVKDPLWNHLDTTYSQYTGETIFPTINEYLLKYSYT